MSRNSCVTFARPRILLLPQWIQAAGEHVLPAPNELQPIKWPLSVNIYQVKKDLCFANVLVAVSLMFFFFFSESQFSKCRFSFVNTIEDTYPTAFSILFFFFSVVGPLYFPWQGAVNAFNYVPKAYRFICHLSAGALRIIRSAPHPFSVFYCELM